MFTIRDATPDDYDAIIDLLNASDLVTSDILVPASRYWIAEDADGRCIGAIGVEFGASKSAALLRSAVVAPAYRGQGLGGTLTRTVFAACRASGHTTLYCFSTDAGDYWLKTGFVVVPVEEVTAELPDAPQVIDFDRRGWLPTEITFRIAL